MSGTSLQITYYKGKPQAAYLRLRLGKSRVRVGSTKKISSSLLVDFDKRGEPLGLEILAFDLRTVSSINKVLVSLGCAALGKEELAPLRVA